MPTHGCHAARSREQATPGRTCLLVLSAFITAAALAGDTAVSAGPRAAILDRAGEAIYYELCAVCHGERGRGDGPLAIGMRPTVMDLRFHMAEGHTDDQLFGWISDGLPGVPLHVYRQELTDEERWAVINFIRVSFSDSP